jgi:hypothetical protein
MSDKFALSVIMLFIYDMTENPPPDPEKHTPDVRES